MTRVPKSNWIAQLTPPARGAVATIRANGQEACRAVERRFQPAAGGALADYPLYRVVFGRFEHCAAEEVVVSRRAADQIDLHCHGSPLVVASILDVLREDGCPIRDWRQLAEPDEDPIRRAARLALADAATERCASILLDQYQGALEVVIAEVCQLLETQQVAAVGRLRDLLRRADIGLHLTKPWRIALTGPVNVGKSSLINALVGYERAIVFDQPGTTRDVVTAATAIDGWPVELIDTAGIRSPASEVEAAGVRRAEQAAREADLVVVVFDSSDPESPADREFLAEWPHALCVMNKSDLDPARPASTDAVATSAMTGRGIEELIAALVARLVPDPTAPGAAVPFSEHQVEILNAALTATVRKRSHEAIERLQELLTASDDVVE